jgi:hypothetical protein
MKKIILLGALISFSVLTPSCDTVDQLLAGASTSGGSSTPGLSNQEVVAGLKEALNIGISNSVNLASVTNGFLNNAKIRLPFPQDAINVRNKAIEWGMKSQVDKFEETLNRAAEEAAKEALPIFKNAITSMSISDGFAILKGGNGAATNYLRENTKSQLVQAFSPKVANAIDKVQLTKFWEPIISKYNLAAPLAGYQKVNPDLNAYVTEKAIDGLFKLVNDEENKIRENAAARVTDLLKKVFGSLGK